jgi:hypothetical protein
MLIFWWCIVFRAALILAPSDAKYISFDWAAKKSIGHARAEPTATVKFHLSSGPPVRTPPTPAFPPVRNQSAPPQTASAGPYVSPPAPSAGRPSLRPCHRRGSKARDRPPPIWIGDHLSLILSRHGVAGSPVGRYQAGGLIAPPPAKINLASGDCQICLPRTQPSDISLVPCFTSPSVADVP